MNLYSTLEHHQQNDILDDFTQNEDIPDYDVQNYDNLIDNLNVDIQNYYILIDKSFL